MPRNRPPGALGATLACLLLGGCAAATVPQPVPPAETPPANGAWPGRYQGWAKSAAGTSMGCQQDVRVDNFHVTANRVSMGPYYGTVEPDGTLVLSLVDPAIRGYFNAGMFAGRGKLETGGQGCLYDLKLARTGP